jgi:uncharacterized membrane protein YkoI
MKRALILIILAVPLLARAGDVKDTADLLKKTKVGIEKAAEEAKKAAPGTVVSARLVKGDDGPVWRVLVLADEKISEVKVDAATGKATLASSWKDESEAEKARPPRPGDGD